MGLTRSRLVYLFAVAVGAALIAFGVYLVYPPAAVILAGLFAAGVGLAGLIEVRP
jgi:hypothetical protein